jgi:dihydroxyacetone kinase
MAKTKEAAPENGNQRRVPRDLREAYEKEATRASKRAGVAIDWWVFAVADMRAARGLTVGSG